MKLREEDISALLAEVNSNISTIEEEIEKVISDKSIKEVLKPKVKSCLEHLKSCLDFCAHDIYELILQPILGVPKGNIYFPYGRTFEDFFRALNNNKFKQLRRYSEAVYTLVESIQPFKAKNDWLIDLCSSTNYNKHDRLGNQERADGLILGTGTSPIIKVDDKSSVTFVDCRFDNKEVNKLTIDKGEVETDADLDKLGLYIISWVDFTFKDTGINILNLLKESNKYINEFQTKLYNLLNV